VDKATQSAVNMASKHQNRKNSTLLPCLAMLLAGISISIGSCRLGETGRDSVEYSAKSGPRPNTWARRIDLPGLPNLHRVSENLYRGAQPTAEGMKQLEKIGIKTVVNLRFLTSDRKLLKDTGLEYEHINTTTFCTDTKDVIRFLKIVTNAERTPVFVHCHRGVDRTGVMFAAYRIVVQDWTKEQAIEEMTKGGFTTRPIKKNLLNDIRKMDVDEIQRCAGLSK